jgi:hypothetical protein
MSIDMFVDSCRSDVMNIVVWHQTCRVVMKKYKHKNYRIYDISSLVVQNSITYVFSHQ